jgi:tRNA G18 (ribose-2'-O)-methylase SpoU
MRQQVDDADDPRLADYAGLTDIDLRTSLEAEHGLFIAEGTKVITRAVAAGYPVRSVLLAQCRLRDLAVLPADAGPVYVVPDAVAERITGYRVHRGALASLHRKPLPAVAGLAAGSSRILVLEDLVDHANVGAIFRCAAALGVAAVILSPRCADPLYRRSVKVSMGAVFAIPYARMTGWYDGLAELRSAGFRLLALTPDPAAVPLGMPLGQAAARERTALLLGTEGDGLSSRWLHEADQAVRIPMHQGALAAGVDSLNVVAAAAIACHWLAGPGELPAVPRPGLDLHLGGGRQGTAARADRLLGDFRAAHAVQVENGRPAGSGPPVAPFGERDQCGREVTSLAGEHVLVQLRLPGVLAALHDPGGDEAFETVLEDVGRDAEAALELVIPGQAGEEGVADDQQAPAFTDQLEGTRDRAHLRVVGLAEHVPSLPT